MKVESGITDRLVVLASPSRDRVRSVQEKEALARAIKINKRFRESLGIKVRPRV